MVTETQSAFSLRIGRDKSYVTRLKQADRLVMTIEGLVDVEASLARMEATRGDRYDVEARNQDHRKGPLNSGSGAGRAKEPQDPPDPLDPLSLEVIGRRTRLAKMAALEADARMKAREDAVHAGALLRKETVKKVITDAVSVILHAGESLPDRLAPLLVSVPEQTRIRAILADEIEQLFRTVSEQLGRIA